MTLAPGTRLGLYEIVARIDVGRAEDSDLQRTVAWRGDATTDVVQITGFQRPRAVEDLP